MQTLLVFSLALFSCFAAAETIVSKIHSISDQEGIIRLTNGRAVLLPSSLNAAEDFIPGSKVKIKTDTENYLKSIQLLERAESQHISLKRLVQGERPEYTPTVLPNLAAATEMFNRLNPNFKRVSECSDRAHVWSYDEFKKNGIKSQKVFAFFTASYINRNKFKWWFHVAPLVQVQEGGKVESRVLDFRYNDRPVLIKEWTDMLVFSKRPCKMTTKFSEYDVNPQTEDCYMIIESMYYRLPGDIHAQELNNQYRADFMESEVNFARKMAFENISVRSN